MSNRMHGLSLCGNLHKSSLQAIIVRDSHNAPGLMRTCERFAFQLKWEVSYQEGSLQNVLPSQFLLVLFTKLVRVLTEAAFYSAFMLVIHFMLNIELLAELFTAETTNATQLQKRYCVACLPYRYRLYHSFVFFPPIIFTDRKAAA